MVLRIPLLIIAFVTTELKIQPIIIFLCPLYATQRATLIASVTEIVQQYNLEILINQSHLYLYGHKLIVFADNNTNHIAYNKFHKGNSTVFNLVSPLPNLGFCYNQSINALLFLFLLFVYVCLVLPFLYFNHVDLYTSGIVGFG